MMSNLGAGPGVGLDGSVNIMILGWDCVVIERGMSALRAEGE
jgi:hypothetical protein